MSIIINKYVDITSGVGGAAGVRNRELIGRILTPSPAILPGQVIEFTSLADVGTLFAVNSPEYRYAAMYFGYVSKTVNTPRRLSMGRWAKSNVPATVVGGVGVLGAAALASAKVATSLNVRVVNNGVEELVTLTLDLTTAADFEAVRSAVQTSLRTSSNSLLASATVLYTASNGVFTVNSGASANPGSITFEAVEPNTDDVSYQLRLLESRGATVSPVYLIQTAVEAVQNTADISDNFGSFGFIDSTSNPPARLSNADVEAVAAWNHAQNVKYIYCIPTSVADAGVLFDALQGLSGAAVSIATATDFTEFCPMEILAATDYDRANASTNYMFVQFGNRSPTVRDTPTSDAMDAVRANYIGQVMTAGQQIAFYQRGILMGGITAPVDMNVYANEMWLKDSISTSIMNAFLALPRIPANDTGRAMLLSNIQYSIDDALNNGTISVGKLLTTTQRAYVTLLSNDPQAWQQIQNVGYWIDVVIEDEVTIDGRTEYKAKYVLIYGKDDQIRRVEGSNTLI